MHLSYTALSISLDLGVAPCPPRVSGHYRGASKRPLEACSSDKHAAQHESKCACIPQRLSAQVDLTLDSDEDCPQGTSSTGAVRVAKPSKSAVEQVCFFLFTHVCRIFLVLSVSSAPSTRHSAPTLPVLAFAKVKLQTGCVGADALETRRGGGPAAEEPQQRGRRHHVCAGLMCCQGWPCLLCVRPPPLVGVWTKFAVLDSRGSTSTWFRDDSMIRPRCACTCEVVNMKDAGPSSSGSARYLLWVSP